MRVITVHSPHDRCGVREYGLQLDRALAARGLDLVPRTFNEDIAMASSGDVVLVHFENNLVPPHYRGWLGEARSRGAKVVFCCHRFEDRVTESEHAGHVDRFVLHREYGVMPGSGKAAVIPLGCPVYEPAEPQHRIRERLGLPLGATIIMTLGFLAPWKRWQEVVKTVISHVPANTFIFVQAPWPYTNHDAAWEQEVRIRQALEKIPDRQRFSTDFLPEIDLLDRVRASDLGFLFHPFHTGSVSAATKQFVSARVPLVVTGSTHASDLRDGICRVESFDVVDFARQVDAVVRDRDRREAMRQGMIREYDRMNMNTVAGQYHDLFNQLVS